MNIIQIREKFTAASLSAGHRRNTLKTYLPIVEDFCRMMRAGTITGPQGYFDHLAQVKRLAPKSVRHAANPLKFLYEQVLEKEFGTYNLPKVSKNRRIPCELSHADIINILMRLSRLPRLQAALLYGCGPRIECELLQLRLKDIHLADGMMIIQSGKGDKSRAVRLPRAILPELEDQIRRCKRQWQADQARGIRTPHQDESLMRKLGNRTFKTLPWYWLFPSRTVQPNGDRWHGTTSELSRELKTVAAELGILQRVHPHAFRHSYATNLLRTGTDIRTIQQQLGHTNLETTEIYAHAMGAKGVESPLDHTAPSIIQFPTYAPRIAAL